ncbi:GNAT family N-acetyltransferase [Chryseobacterium sp. 2987]|uniref:GNAT family N-acetyltransferase n=1 Tax=Chryseobacterium sp. 2987 TaxID=2817767 RepID=UPI002854C8A3|nr:GNAT family N-acetyltransferase [Chryseobacterium sp. 2987]MDR6923309.1 putative acetyltransferase [Chryseobacterium sp. 2987]
MNSPTAKIREGNNNDLAKMKQLFTDTITHICKKDYDDVQIEAWKLGAENEIRWQKVMENQYVLIAESNGEITGFISLDQGNYIDFLFVHKDYQNQGIAFQLYQLIEHEAIKQEKTFMTADVSKTAKPFFEKMGFSIVREQSVPVRGVELTNYKMEKKLL